MDLINKYLSEENKDTGWKAAPTDRKDKYGNPVKTSNVAKSLARKAMKSAISDLKKGPEAGKRQVEEVELDEEEGFSPRGHRNLATHHFNKAKELYQKADSAENSGDSSSADHYNDIAGKHATAYRAHEKASTDPKYSKEAHEASHEANSMIVDEGVELDEATDHSQMAAMHSAKAQEHGKMAASYHSDTDSSDLADRHMELSREHAKAATLHTKAAKSGNPDHSHEAHEASADVKYLAKQYNESVEQIDEISLKDRLAGKTAPVVKSKYNRSKANRPMTAKEREAHNRSKALDLEKMPKPDHAKDYTIKHKSSHTEEGELEDATYHNYDILHKGKKVGTHHFADYFGHGTTTIHGHKEYDTGYVGNTERLHHYMKTKKGFSNVFGKKEGEQKHAEYVAKHGIKKYAKEEVELDEAMRHKIAGAIGQFIGNKIDPVHGEIMRVHGEEAYRQAAYHIRKTLSGLHDTLKKHLSSGKLQTEEVELDEGKYGSFRVRTTSGTFGGPKLPRRPYVSQGDKDPRTGLPLGFSNPPEKSEKPETNQFNKLDKVKKAIRSVS